jgi:hypothetical protein
VRRSFAAAVVIAALIASAVSAFNAVADARGKHPVTGIGIQLVDVPAATADDPRARAYIIDHLAPGSVIERRILVTNGTGSPLDVTVYPAAASIKNGEFLAAKGHTPNDLSTWTSATPFSLELSPHEKSFVHVTIQVPSNAAPGETYAVVWAEVTTPPSTPGGLTQVSRVGIRIYLSIGPGGDPASDFDIMSLTAARDNNDAPMVQASIRNTGGRALDLSGELTLSEGPGGLSAGPFQITVGTTLGIGQTEPVSVSLNEQLPDGPWLATIKVESGLTKRTAKATLTFPSGPGSGATVSAQSPFSAHWWVIAAGVAALLLLLLGLARYVSQRRAREREPRPDL